MSIQQILFTDGSFAPDTFTWVLESDAELPAGEVIVSVDMLPQLGDVMGKKGVFLTADDSPEVVELPLSELDIIAINFETFNDGRGYSFARLLRRQGYTGELRAVGDVFKDTLFYMKRSGFDSFAIKDDKSVEVAAGGLTDFSAGYQGSQLETPSFQVGA